MVNGEAKLKVTAYVEPVTMRLLARPAVGEGVAESLRVFADLIADRTRVLGNLLSVYDWEFLSLACETVCCDELRAEESWHALVMHAIEEAHDANGHHLAVWRSDPEGNYKILHKTAGKLDDLEAVAILTAVRFYHGQDRDSLVAQGWWEVQHRVRPKRAKVKRAKKVK